ncbi:hypothetical protein HDU87_008412 [Geranomyces variabilis]|uniref:Uncharacterized protein n=1 Tax=Geranomyces variabilis TaxID=109894 RepID=A0AAD5TIB6_9FUNG|nr:hypothetical protein HDU87_008412 [Geranomyces variabilis]
MSTAAFSAVALPAESTIQQLMPLPEPGDDSTCARWLKLSVKFPQPPGYDKVLRAHVFDIADHLADFGYPTEIDRQVFCRQLEAKKDQWEHYAADWAAILNPGKELPHISTPRYCLLYHVEEMMGESPSTFPKSYVTPLYYIFHPLNAFKIVWSREKSAGKSTRGSHKYSHID